MRLWLASFALGVGLGVVASHLILLILDWPHWVLVYVVVGLVAGFVCAELTRSALSGRAPE